MKKHTAKIVSVIISIAVTVCCFASCGKKTEESGKLNIVCTIFPQYDWAREILGDRLSEVNLTLLLDSGVDLHSYTADDLDDIDAIKNSSVFVFVGGESDEWIPGVLETVDPEGKINTVELMSVLASNVVEEETCEGMAPEEEEEGETEYDEHVWLSLKNAIVCCNAICDAICGADPDNAETYKANCKAYTEKLAALDGQYSAAVENAATSKILVADRFPFVYMAKDYGLTYAAAFKGCTSDASMSFDTINTLTEILKRDPIGAIIITENGDEDTANMIKDQSGKDVPVLMMNAMQSVTLTAAGEGVNYYDTMVYNLSVLTEALG